RVPRRAVHDEPRRPVRRRARASPAGSVGGQRLQRVGVFLLTRTRRGAGHLDHHRHAAPGCAGAVPGPVRAPVRRHFDHPRALAIRPLLRPGSRPGRTGRHSQLRAKRPPWLASTVGLSSDEKRYGLTCRLPALMGAGCRWAVITAASSVAVCCSDAYHGAAEYVASRPAACHGPRPRATFIAPRQPPWPVAVCQSLLTRTVPAIPRAGLTCHPVLRARTHSRP